MHADVSIIHAETHTMRTITNHQVIFYFRCKTFQDLFKNQKMFIKICEIKV